MPLHLNSLVSRRVHFAVRLRDLTGMSKDNDESLRRRFESYLPKYGTLWKSMAPKRPFLSSTESKSMISRSSGEGFPLYERSDGTCSETSSGGSTAVAFDLSNLRIHDDEVEDEMTVSVVGVSFGEQSDLRDVASDREGTFEGFDPPDSFLKLGEPDTLAEDSDAERPTKQEVEGGHTEDSFEYIEGAAFDVCDSVQSTRDDDDSNSDDSSGGSTVVRFDISHLQDDYDSVQELEDFEILPPLSPSLKLINDQNLANTPIGENQLSIWRKADAAKLVKDDDHIDSSRMRPRILSEVLEIVSCVDSDSEVEWTDHVDSDISDEESQNSESTIISISDDGSCWRDGPVLSTCPGKPVEAKLLSKAQFRKNRERLTQEAFAEFNEVVFDGKLNTVTVTWSSKLRTTAGVARCTKERKNSDRRFASIELSMKVIDEYQRLRHTLLHEMCHAAQWLVDGAINPPHGACFKKWANLAMSRINGVTVTTTHSFAIQYKYAWACTTERCGVVFQRQSKSIDVNKHFCGKCKGRLVEINVPLKGAMGTAIDRRPKKPKALSGYASFVKENASQVRSRMELARRMGDSIETVSQPEVMRECAKLWHALKNTSS